MSCSDTEQATESPKPSGEVWQRPWSGTAPELGHHLPVRRGLRVYVVRQESRERCWALKSHPRPRLKAKFSLVPERLLSLTSLALGRGCSLQGHPLKTKANLLQAPGLARVKASSQGIQAGICLGAATLTGSPKQPSHWRGGTAHPMHRGGNPHPACGTGLPPKPPQP